MQTTIQPDAIQAAAISGHVLGPGRRPLPGAMVLLQRPREGAAPEAVGTFITDDDGQFFFGPLEPEKLYLVKVFHNNVKLRELEIAPE